MPDSPSASTRHPSPPSADTPYAGLDPASVLDSLDAVGFRGDGRILQLNSYENRVFQVHLEDGRAVVAKFYRPGRWTDAQILEEHRFARQLAEADVPVVAPLGLAPLPAAAGTRADEAPPRFVGSPATLAHTFVQGSEHRVAVCERRAGRAPNLEDPQVLRWLGRFVGRLHVVGEAEPFLQRRRLDVATYGLRAREIVQTSPYVDEASLAPWLAACDTALGQVQRAFDACGHAPSLRLHGDLHPGNILWREVDEASQGGPHIVDLDDACSGPAIQDLWMLLSGDAVTMQLQLDTLLEGYRLFRDFDRREAALIEPLRTLRMIHHSAWIAERWRDPAFPAAFPWFETPGYWGQQAMQLREQVEAMA